MIEAEQTAQPPATDDSAGSRKVDRPGRDQGIVPSLMVSLAMIVSDVFRDCPTQMPLPQWDESLEALGFDRVRSLPAWTAAKHHGRAWDPFEGSPFKVFATTL